MRKTPFTVYVPNQYRRKDTDLIKSPLSFWASALSQIKITTVFENTKRTCRLLFDQLVCVLNMDHGRNQVESFSEQFQAHIESGAVSEHFETHTRNLWQVLQNSLREIDNKYSQNQHNPNDVALLGEKSDQINKLTTENERLRRYLSNVTSLPIGFDHGNPNSDLMINAWKAQVKELAGCLENQIMNLVAQAP